MAAVAAAMAAAGTRVPRLPRPHRASARARHFRALIRSPVAVQSVRSGRRVRVGVGPGEGTRRGPRAWGFLPLDKCHF